MTRAAEAAREHRSRSPPAREEALLFKQMDGSAEQAAVVTKSGGEFVSPPVTTSGGTFVPPSTVFGGVFVFVEPYTKNTPVNITRNTCAPNGNLRNFASSSLNGWKLCSWHQAK